MEIPISNNTEEFEEKVTEKTTENNENNKVKEKLTKKDIKEKNDTCEEKKTKDDLLKEYKEQLQRVQAEFINYRKRIENERKRDFLIAKGSMISSILPVLDDFDRMFEHYKGKKQCNLEEIKMIYNNLKRILEEQEPGLVTNYFVLVGFGLVNIKKSLKKVRKDSNI